MTCNFTSFLTVFQSYQDDVWMIMKGCVQWNSVYGWEDFTPSEDWTWSARSVGQRLTHWASWAPDKREYLMIIFLISHQNHMLWTPHLNRLVEMVLMMGHKICINGELSINYLCYLFLLSGALICFKHQWLASQGLLTDSVHWFWRPLFSISDSHHLSCISFDLQLWFLIAQIHN